jgi:hypothetical protein
MTTEPLITLTATDILELTESVNLGAALGESTVDPTLAVQIALDSIDELREALDDAVTRVLDRNRTVHWPTS